MEFNKKTFKVYLPFARSEIQRALAYRLGFLGNVLANMLQIAVSLYLWSAIFNSASKSRINGFSKEEMLVYVIMSFLTSMTIGSGTEWIVSSEVRKGQIAINLIRPINYKLRLMAQSMGSIFWQFIVIFLPIWLGMIAIRYFTLGKLPPNIMTILTYMISLILSFIIWFLFNFSFGLAAFVVTYMWGLTMFKETIVKFVSGSIIPILFFPLWFQKILSFLPFGSINYTPVMIYLNKYNSYQTIKVLGIQVVWVIILFILSNFFWNKATKRLSILGG